MGSLSLFDRQLLTNLALEMGGEPRTQKYAESLNGRVPDWRGMGEGSLKEIKFSPRG